MDLYRSPLGGWRIVCFVLGFRDSDSWRFCESLEALIGSDITNNRDVFMECELCLIEFKQVLAQTTYFQFFISFCHKSIVNKIPKNVCGIILWWETCLFVIVFAYTQSSRKYKMITTHVIVLLDIKL